MASLREKLTYPCVLDHKPRFFLGWFLYRLFQRVRLDENMKEKLKRMHKEGTVVYAVKYKGKLDYLLYHYNFRRKRLPFPKIAFDLNISLLLPFSDFFRIALNRMRALWKYRRLPSPYETGFYEEALKRGITSLVFLVDPKGFLSRFIHGGKDNILFLLETQKKMERPIFIVPQLVLYKKTPEKDYASLLDIFFGFKDKPGTIRKIVLFFRHNRRAIIDFAEPLNLQTYIREQMSTKSMEEMASEIRRRLIDGIDRQKRIILGPIMKSRQQFKEMVLMDAAVREQIEAMGHGNDKKLKQLKRKAGEYFEEIAADYNINYVQFFRLGLKWLWKKIFSGIDLVPAELARVREWARRGTLIYVPSHKSHIDYLVLNYFLYDFHMHIPRVAAGRNLAFWPMGHMFRKSGAFFLRRSFKNAKLYLRVFNKYIKTLIEEGHPIEFFIEGGRSRNGKLVYPKTGFLSILLQAFQEGACKDLIFVPTSIVYDRIMEERSYLKEISGGDKESENVGQMLRARRFLKRTYGKIYIRFHEPFSLNEYLAARDPHHKQMHRDLAFHLMKSINAVSLATPLSLMATAVLARHRRGFHHSDILETFEQLIAFLRRYQRPLSDSLDDPSKAVSETLSLLLEWRILEVLENPEGREEAFYYADEERKLKLEYYKNSIIHFFQAPSFLAVSLMSGSEDIKDMGTILSDYRFLKRLFRHEFVFDDEGMEEANVSSMLDYFREAGFLSGSLEEGGYAVTKRGHDNLPLWGSLVKTYLESYWIAFKALGQQKELSNLRKESLLKSIDELGRQLYKQGVIEHLGALSRMNYKNALTYLQETLSPAQDGAPETGDPMERIAQLTSRLYELSHYKP